ncbi:hypothetical protein [Budvicia aquatica]|uniref:Uncharacterized protein n=1 Tax=Budvicia aquatica TaxID=82979 RepID=A0A2C6DLC5_9GAMM|nr:hypothetical protein [Budvicia aquatica]PHI29255.1 hypothetical protein CRN84_07945 [Budvicia aquatica]VFS47472.1 Uncharacterised protein [Budvicia aquatica]
MKKTKSKLFGFNDEDLSQQGPFKLAIIIPILLFFITGVPVWCDYTIGFSKASYVTFLEISQFPLYLLSISIPAVAIVAHIHRTIQTAKQIQLTIDKNLPDSFYTQLKAMVDLFKTLPSTKLTRVNNDGTLKNYTFEMQYTYKLFYSIYKESSAESGASFKVDTSFTGGFTSQFQEIEKRLNYVKFLANINHSSQTEAVLCEGMKGQLFVEIATRIQSIYLFIGYDTDGFFYENNSPSDLAMSFKSEDEFKVVLSSIVRIVDHLFGLLNIKDNAIELTLKNLLAYALHTDCFFPEKAFTISASKK